MADGSPDDGSARALLIAAIPRVRKFALALTGAPDRADDLTQTTLERALTNIDRFVPGTRMESWLLRIAYHAAVDDARRRKRRGHHGEISDHPELSGQDGRRDVNARLDLSAAHTAMMSLPEDQRAVLALIALEGMSYQQAAETLEIPIGTVMSRVARARRAIVRAVDGEGGNR